MSRSQVVNWYQLEVLSDNKDQYVREPQGNSSVSFRDGIMKVADIPISAETRTVFRQAKDSETAKRLAAKLGKVLSCFRLKESERYEAREKWNQRILLENQPLIIQLAENTINLDVNLNVSIKRRGIPIKVVDK